MRSSLLSSDTTIACSRSVFRAPTTKLVPCTAFLLLHNALRRTYTPAYSPASQVVRARTITREMHHSRIRMDAHNRIMGGAIKARHSNPTEHRHNLRSNILRRNNHLNHTRTYPNRRHLATTTNSRHRSSSAKPRTNNTLLSNHIPHKHHPRRCQTQRAQTTITATTPKLSPHNHPCSARKASHHSQPNNNPLHRKCTATLRRSRRPCLHRLSLGTRTHHILINKLLLSLSNKHPSNSPSKLLPHSSNGNNPHNSNSRRSRSRRPRPGSQRRMQRAATGLRVSRARRRINCRSSTR